MEISIITVGTLPAITHDALLSPVELDMASSPNISQRYNVATKLPKERLCCCSVNTSSDFEHISVMLATPSGRLHFEKNLMDEFHLMINALRIEQITITNVEYKKGKYVDLPGHGVVFFHHSHYHFHFHFQQLQFL